MVTLVRLERGREISIECVQISRDNVVIDIETRQK